MRFPNMREGCGIVLRLLSFILINGAMLFSSAAYGASGKILATPGVFQVEGAAGGGLVPWAQLAGYASDEEFALSGFCSRAQVDDYRLNVCGAQANFFDHVEISLARQNFLVDALDAEIEQDIVGFKTRLYGDIIYTAWPQVSLGVQHKKLADPAIAYLLGAERDSGTDIYLAASKLHLGAVVGYNFFWNVTARSTNANQLGILGFGGPRDNRTLNIELSSAIFINPHWALGFEYRQKPDNLVVREDDWRDLFVAWFPNKSVSLTAAWLDLGHVAGQSDQHGWYFSLGGYW